MRLERHRSAGGSDASTPIASEPSDSPTAMCNIALLHIRANPHRPFGPYSLLVVAE